MPDWMIGALLGLAAGPLLRIAVVRYAVPYGEPWRACPVRPDGRCGRCGERFGPLPGSVELTAAAVGAALAATQPPGRLPVLVWLALFGVVLAFVDGAVHRLPDALTLPLLAGTAVLLPLADHRPAALLRCVLAAGVLGLLFWLLALFAPVGLGDAKLAPSLGAVLGLLGWSALYAAVLYMWVAAALWAVLLLVARGAGRSTELAFGPAMLLGTLLALV
ncbi:prepilin peptidase [Kitasatospora sp. NPDC049285]|uniref:prepilin peptidase n=1 Tax=Kitasatospora sp. NPDC049285 TaxID=3157096 RepID=UPI003415C1D1